MKTEIEGIHLTRYGNHYTVVEVQIGGIWYEVIREIFDNNYDHFVTAKGIDDTVYRQNLKLLKNDNEEEDEGDVLQGPLLMTDEQVERLRGNRE